MTCLLEDSKKSKDKDVIALDECPVCHNDYGENN